MFCGLQKSMWETAARVYLNAWFPRMLPFLWPSLPLSPSFPLSFSLCFYSHWDTWTFLSPLFNFALVCFPFPSISSTLLSPCSLLRSLKWPCLSGFWPTSPLQKDVLIVIPLSPPRFLFFLSNINPVPEGLLHSFLSSFLILIINFTANKCVGWMRELYIKYTFTFLSLLEWVGLFS